MSSALGVKAGTGYIGTRTKRKLCDCRGCTERRVLECDMIEARIDRKRAAGKRCPPPTPDQNAPTTFRLQ